MPLPALPCDKNADVRALNYGTISKQRCMGEAADVGPTHSMTPREMRLAISPSIGAPRVQLGVPRRKLLSNADVRAPSFGTSSKRHSKHSSKSLRSSPGS